MAGTAYTYDDNGNMTSDGTSSYTWDKRNRMTGSGSLAFSYKADGSRYRTADSTSGTALYNYYLSPYEEIRNGVKTYYLFAGSQRVASLEGTTYTYYHSDHLGGTALTSDSTGAASQIYDYYPYGSELINEQIGSSEIHHSFTDKELEDALGLYYFEARWYSPTIGRFASIDPISFILGDKKEEVHSANDLLNRKGLPLNKVGMGEPVEKFLKQLFDPQLLNTYSYARNNPISFIDPSGLEAANFWDVLDDGYDATVGWKDYASSLVDTVIQTVGSVIDEMADTNGNISEVDTDHIKDQTQEAYEHQQNTGLDAMEDTVEFFINIGNLLQGEDPQDYDIRENELNPRDE